MTTPKCSPLFPKFDLRPSVDWEYVECFDLIQLFANLRTFDTTNAIEADDFIPYDSVWAGWLHLESVRLVEGPLEENYDAEVLGIFDDEVERLRQEDDETLVKMHIVPIRPSVLTMTRKH